MGLDRENWTIVAMAPNDWRGPWMNRQQLLSRLAARGWNVVYDTGALFVSEVGTKRWQEARVLPHLAAVNGVRVLAPGRALLRWPRFAPSDRLVVRAHTAWLRRALRGPRRRRSLYWVFHPGFLPYVLAAEPDKLVYHVYDALSLSGGWNERTADSERELVGRADRVVAVTPQMADLLPSAARPKIVIVPNGADVAAFGEGSRLPCPADLASIPRPRIGYVGVVSAKVDLPLVASVARSRPEWHWVLVGRVVTEDNLVSAGEEVWAGLEQCRALGNVHFLGEREPGALPAYVGHMDINTMCYRADTEGWWQAGYPLKLHEYLASGNPIVSSDLPTVREFQPAVRIAFGPEDWIHAIGEGLDGNNPEAVARRRALARENSWDNRVDQLEGMLHRMLNPSGGDTP